MKQLRRTAKQIEMMRTIEAIDQYLQGQKALLSAQGQEPTWENFQKTQEYRARVLSKGVRVVQHTRRLWEAK